MKGQESFGYRSDKEQTRSSGFANDIRQKSSTVDTSIKDFIIWSYNLYLFTPHNFHKRGHIVLQWNGGILKSVKTKNKTRKYTTI